VARIMNKLLAVLARKLEREDEPRFLTSLTILVLALCVLAALLL
jgi:hypothetical protein